MAAGASVLTISAGGAAIYSKYIHRRPPPFIVRARTRMGYLLRDKYARRPHECNAAAVRSTHESARARALTHAHARCAFIKRRTYGARVRATRRLLGGTFPRRRHPSCPGSRNPSLPSRAYALPLPADVRIPRSRGERRFISTALRRQRINPFTRR